MKKIDLTDLAVSDVYSLAMFLLFKFKEIPQYEVISELPYLLDKENLLNFLNYYGGKTIVIPTQDEFMEFLQLILFYQYFKVEGKTFDESLNLSQYSGNLRSLSSKIIKIDDFMQRYQFKRETKYE